MDIAASAGKLGLKFIGQHMPEAVKMTEKFVAGQGFNKVMGKLFPEGLGGNSQGKGELPPGLAKLLDPSRFSPQMSTQQSLDYLKQFDLNQDGQVSKVELDQTLNDTQVRLEGLQKRAHEGTLTAGEAQELEGLRMKRRLAGSLARHYDQVSNLDFDKTGIAVDDLKNLASRDQDKRSVSMRDWQNLLG